MKSINDQIDLCACTFVQMTIANTVYVGYQVLFLIFMPTIVQLLDSCTALIIRHA